MKNIIAFGLSTLVKKPITNELKNLPTEASYDLKVPEGVRTDIIPKYKIYKEAKIFKQRNKKGCEDIINVNPVIAAKE